MPEPMKTLRKRTFLFDGESRRQYPMTRAFLAKQRGPVERLSLASDLAKPKARDAPVQEAESMRLAA